MLLEFSMVVLSHITQISVQSLKYDLAWCVGFPSYRQSAVPVGGCSSSMLKRLQAVCALRPSTSLSWKFLHAAKSCALYILACAAVVWAVLWSQAYLRYFSNALSKRLMELDIALMLMSHQDFLYRAAQQTLFVIHNCASLHCAFVQLTDKCVDWNADNVQMAHTEARFLCLFVLGGPSINFMSPHVSKLRLYTQAARSTMTPLLGQTVLPESKRCSYEESLLWGFLLSVLVHLKLTWTA